MLTTQTKTKCHHHRTLHKELLYEDTTSSILISFLILWFLLFWTVQNSVAHFDYMSTYSTERTKAKAIDLCHEQIYQ
jgi:hypothetical protein